MLKLIAHNKYKILVFIIGLYLLIDVLQHRGQTRVLLLKKFPAYNADGGLPKSKSILINTDKNWKKAVNTSVLMKFMNTEASGFECDVYFDTAKNIFDVHHDEDKSIGLSLNTLLELYNQKKITASIWLDFKNLDNTNSKSALLSLIQIRNKYSLENKILVESNRADLLTNFSDSGFYTSYYTPMFNPYKINDAEIKLWADSISIVIKNAKLNALSGYYFQSSFLQQYFPGYPVLLWTENNRFSLVNRLLKRKINRNKAIFIALYP